MLRHYVFGCASDVTALSVCLGKCPQKCFLAPTEAERLGTKMARRQKSICFYVCFEFCTLIARSMTSEKKAVFPQITWGRAVGKRPQNEPQKALHEAVCEASERRNRAVAAVALILGKICSFESPDRHRRGHDLQKKAQQKKRAAKIDMMTTHDRSKVGRSEPKSAQTLRLSMCQRRR